MIGAARYLPALMPYLPMLWKHRHVIREFLPIVREVLELLRDQEPEAKRLAARPETTPLQDITELAVKKEPNLTEKMFKI